MNQNMTVQETVQMFCSSWFEQRDVAAVLALVDEDICFAGTGEKVDLRGKRKMEEYLWQDVSEIPEPFAYTLTPIYEQHFTENSCNFFAKLALRNSMYQWHLRGSFTMFRTEGRWLVCSLHFSESSSLQLGEEHYPRTLVMENAANQRELLMNETLPGGILSGYVEDGFPFQFINHRMLKYLGYDTEEEFIIEIQGLLQNCVYPEDWPMLKEKLQREIVSEDGSGEYMAEYRMRKKDGTFIWVQDIGRRAIAEDGRPIVNTLSIDITAQKKAQEEVLHLHNNIPGAVFRCRFDADFSVIEANQGLFDFIGYTREEFAGMGNRMSAVIYPEDYVIMADKLKAQLQYGNTIHNENRLVCKDGRVKWISIKAQFIQGIENEAFFYCVFVDITEEKQLQERARESFEKELTYFAEMSSSGGSTQGRINLTQNCVESYLFTSDVNVADVGDSYDKTIENLACTAVEAACGEDIRKRLNREQMLADYASGQGEFHYEFLRRRNNGDVFWGSTSFRLQTNPETGDVIAFFYTFDITEQKLKEQLLGRMAELDFDVVVDIDILQDRFDILMMNIEEGDYPPQDCGFREAIHSFAQQCMDEKAAAVYLSCLDYSYMKEQLALKETYSFAVEHTCANGEQQTKRYKVFYIDRHLGRVCMARTDVTDVVRQEQKQREELKAALAAAEHANTAKSEFLSRMSHEIRTPLNAILGMSAIAEQSLEDPERVEDCISKISNSSHFLLSLINDILDMSRIESGKLMLKEEVFDTETFITSINSICFTQAETRGVAYECIADPELEEHYLGDAMKLQQVLINIISNAVKFTEAGGRVLFTIARQEHTDGEDVLRFIIKDTGMGIQESYLPHIFEPFSQESNGTISTYGGTGLGLAISKNIVDMMKGTIDVRSKKGSGSEFTVEVRLRHCEKARSERDQCERNASIEGLRVLVVDDNLELCRNITAMLSALGCEAEWVDGGEKAVEWFKLRRDAGAMFDVLLIDKRMPNLSGMETVCALRRLAPPEVKIILTAYDRSTIEYEAKRSGVDLLLSKPVLLTSLRDALHKLLGQREKREKATYVGDYDFSGKRILLAEDNPLNIEIATLLLQSKGVDVESAENGLRAVELFQKSPLGYYDAVLMDIRMPCMDGLTAAEQIRQMQRWDAGQVPIIAMTANAFDEDIDKSRRVGMNAHLAKPVEPERLYQTLFELIMNRTEQ